MKIALVYDRVNKWGGAEQILLSLHEMFPNAPLYTSLFDSKNASWAKVFKEIKTSFLQKIPWARTRHEYLGTFMPIVFESFDFSNFDLVISVTSEAAKGILVKPPTKHIAIVLTPTRYLWSEYEVYFKNPILKFVSYPFVSYLKKWDIIASQRPDKLVAISKEVKKRIFKYYKRDSEIIYPPVDLSKLIPLKELNNIKKDYYLLVSRLVAYKKVDLAIKAFNRLGKKLIIVGGGTSERKLKKIAKKNINFLGIVELKNLTRLYQEARALIMPQEEDFGIVSIESQFLNTSVIAYQKGGSLDTVINRKTGIFFQKQTVDSLVSAVKEFEKQEFLEQDLLQNSKKFSKDVFKEKILSIIKYV
ncbi:glycosyltransferase [Patescibacteria group bacterium]|nr:glycosyltransferase [Patescibacteria group bacterium]MBU2035875.1 glycosyltransferase [Patescibacteria group bacterium]